MFDRAVSERCRERIDCHPLQHIEKAGSRAYPESRIIELRRFLKNLRLVIHIVEICLEGGSEQGSGNIVETILRGSASTSATASRSASTIPPQPASQDLPLDPPPSPETYQMPANLTPRPPNANSTPRPPNAIKRSVSIVDFTPSGRTNPGLW